MSARRFGVFGRLAMLHASLKAAKKTYRWSCGPGVHCRRALL